LGREVERHLSARRGELGASFLPEEVERLHEVLGRAVINQAAADLDLRNRLHTAREVEAVRSAVHRDDAEPPWPIARPIDVSPEGNVEPDASAPPHPVRRLPAVARKRRRWPRRLQVRLRRTVSVERLPRT